MLSKLYPTPRANISPPLCLKISFEYQDPESQKLFFHCLFMLEFSNELKNTLIKHVSNFVVLSISGKIEILTTFETDGCFVSCSTLTWICQYGQDIVRKIYSMV
jgi:hypothetical protein